MQGSCEYYNDVNIKSEIHQTWAIKQWGDAELGDSRRTDRAIAANPQASLPNIMEGWNEIRAAISNCQENAHC